ncbi:hypothetical protein GCM10009715_22100 [Paeniglutamicibacter psychrophenolicus]
MAILGLSGVHYCTTTGQNRTSENGGYGWRNVEAYRDYGISIQHGVGGEARYTQMMQDFLSIAADCAGSAQQ